MGSTAGSDDLYVHARDKFHSRRCMKAGPSDSDRKAFDLSNAPEGSSLGPASQCNKPFDKCGKKFRAWGPSGHKKDPVLYKVNAFFNDALFSGALFKEASDIAGCLQAFCAAWDFDTCETDSLEDWIDTVSLEIGTWSNDLRKELWELVDVKVCEWVPEPEPTRKPPDGSSTAQDSANHNVGSQRHDTVKSSEPRESSEVGSTFKFGTSGSSYGIILTDGKSVLYSDAKEGNFDVASARTPTVDNFIYHMPNVKIIDKVRDRILDATKDAECEKANGGCKALEKVHERLNAMVDFGIILKVDSTSGTFYGIISTRRTENGERGIMYNDGKEEWKSDFANAKPATLEEFIRATSDRSHIEKVRKRVEVVIKERKKANDDSLKKALDLLDSNVDADWEECQKFRLDEQRAPGIWAGWLFDGHDSIKGMKEQPKPCLCAFAAEMKRVDISSMYFKSIENYEADQPCNDILLGNFRGELESEGARLSQDDKTNIFSQVCAKVATPDTIKKCP